MILSFYTGIVEIKNLFPKESTKIKFQYISLLEQFELAMKLNNQQMIITSMLPHEATYHNPSNVPADKPSQADYYPTIYRFWLSDFVTEGFWPRVIHRVATDQHIEDVSDMII